MQLPGRMPGVLAAVILGTGIHFFLGFSGYLPEFAAPTLDMHFALPVPSRRISENPAAERSLSDHRHRFGILTIIGGINNTEKRAAGG